MAESNDNAVVALRDILGHTLDDADLKKLLHRAGNDVGVALNLHYDQSARADAPKRSAPSVPSFFDRRKCPKTESSQDPTAIDVVEASSQLKSPSVVDVAHTKPAMTSTAPLAERMRPKEMDDLLGQEDALGAVLRQAVQEDHLPSLILWGPPGCGKTSFAHCVAAATRRSFRSLSAAKAGTLVYGIPCISCICPPYEIRYILKASQNLRTEVFPSGSLAIVQVLLSPVLVRFARLVWRSCARN